MSAPAPAPLLEPEPVNPLDLSSRMGIGIDVLSRAIRADMQALADDPRSCQWQPGLRTVAELWQNLLILFGTEEDARLFLSAARPELNGRTAISYFEAGRPKVVLNLVMAMREKLP